MSQEQEESPNEKLNKETFVLGPRDEIEDSAMAGCHLCSLALSLRKDFDVGAFHVMCRQGKRYRELKDVISLEISQEVMRQPEKTLKIRCLSDRDQENKDPHKYDGEDEKESHWLYVDCASPDETQGAAREHTISSSTDADEVFQLASSWLKACLEAHHAYCGGAAYWGPTKPITGFPTRLVHIPSEDIKQGLRLEEFGVDEEARSSAGLKYLILSHCWGQLKFDTLTRSNRANFRQGIAFDALSKTFQDALWITRRLGFEYIWIDSLCIVQDDRNDWRQESLRMGDYYANAVCNISALGGENGSAGCFQSRNPLFFLPCNLNLFTGKGITIGPPQEQHLRYIESQLHGKKASPLHNRAWVIQERLLSKRTLYYGSTGIYWECLQGQASEWSPKPPSVAGGAVFAPEWFQYNMKRQLYPLLRSPLYDGGILGFHQSWSEILKEYTSCELTHQSDKLIAISGITSLVERETNWRSCAGLWESCLVQSLLWRREGYLPGTRINSETLPTWSWASLKSPVRGFYINFKWPEKMIEPRLDVEAAIVDDTVGSTAARQPLQCRLQFRWGMLKLTTSKQPSKSNAAFPSRYVDILYVDNKSETWAEFWPDVDITEGTVVGAIPMIRWDKEGQSDTYSGLVVSRMEGNNDMWQRVGYFEKSVRASASAQHLTDLFKSILGFNPCGPEDLEPWEEAIYDDAASVESIILM